MENAKKEKTKKYILRVKAKHPDGRFYIQGHRLSTQYGEYQLNEKEEKELESEGCKAWVDIGDEVKAKADFDLRKKIKLSQKDNSI